MLLIRCGEAQDLTEVAAIQADSPEASAWEVGAYLEHDFRVATDGGRIAGFLVARAVAPEERELLNLAVAPNHRRRGVARALVQAFLEDSPGAVFLEVRESNRGARASISLWDFMRLA